MDEMRVRTPWLKGLMAKAVMRYLKKRGIDVELVVHQLELTSASDSENGINPDKVSVRADIGLTLPRSAIDDIFNGKG